VEINLESIHFASINRREENKQFKEFLKATPVRNVDVLVQNLNEEVTSKIDCTACANCCKILEPPVDETEIKRLAQTKNLTTTTFENEYVGKEDETNIQFLKCQPCIFLQEKQCAVYEKRPASCADYPHLTSPNFKYRWKSVMTNYGICPIVFNVVEKLKVKVGFSFKPYQPELVGGLPPTNLT
jgi:uncharacterized protein